MHGAYSGPPQSALRNYMYLWAGISSDSWECRVSAPSIDGCVAWRLVPGWSPYIHEDNMIRASVHGFYRDETSCAPHVGPSEGPQNWSNYFPATTKSDRPAHRAPWRPCVESTSQCRARVNMGLEREIRGITIKVAPAIAS
eukprot:750402-Pyramimonas_sp.AAC.1